MRYLLPLLLLACPLLAQDDKDKKDEHAQLREWIQQIQNGDEKQREEATKKLTAWAMKQKQPALGLFQDSAVVLEFQDDKNRETIRGRWRDGENRGTYTLKSLGTGRYDLLAEIKAPDGKILQRFKDQGTLADLRKKFDFLKSSVALGFTRVKTQHPFQFGAWNTRTRSTTAVAPFGIRVKRPSPELAYHFYLAPDVGFVVEHVDKNSHAEASGLKPHDVLFKLNGKYIESLEQLKNLKGELEIIRRAEKQTLKIGARR